MAQAGGCQVQAGLAVRERSDDAGATWQLTHQEPIRKVGYTYGYYFGQIRVAPDDPDRLYILGVPLLSSSDGGATWENRRPLTGEVADFVPGDDALELPAYGAAVLVERARR